MSNKTINQLPEVRTEDVQPKYTPEETLNYIARAVSYMRESQKTKYPTDGRQLAILELMYSLACMIKK